MDEPQNDETLIDELPELADDGSVGIDAEPDTSVDLDALEREASVLDDSLLDDAFDPGFEEDETSWVGAEEGQVDIGTDDLGDESEDGFTDDAPAEGLDVGFEVPSENPPVMGSDVGQEGLDEPIVPRLRGEDETDLPPLDRTGSDEADDLDVGVTLIVPG